jgi:hypothetical protein
VSGSSREARKALNASQKFIALKPLRGLDIRLRLNVTPVIQRRLPALKILRPVFKFFDDLMTEIIHIRSSFWQRRINPCQHLTFEYISAIDKETDQFIRQHHQADLTRKGKRDLSWIMNNPWILSAPLKDLAAKRYYFSSRADRFLYLAVKVYARPNKMIGFFLLKVRDDRMSVAYSYFKSRHARSIMAAVYHHALMMNVSLLSVYNDQLIAGYLELDCPCWSTKKKSREISLSKAFADLPLANFRLQGGEGDLAFY